MALWVFVPEVMRCREVNHSGIRRAMDTSGEDRTFRCDGNLSRSVGRYQLSSELNSQSLTHSTSIATAGWQWQWGVLPLLAGSGEFCHCWLAQWRVSASAGWQWGVSPLLAGSGEFRHCSLAQWGVFASARWHSG